MNLSSKDFWQRNTSYVSNDRHKSFVVYNDVLYVCIEPHISGTEFDETKFSASGGSTGGGSGDVASVFGRTGVVTAQTGDYTAEQVGADPAGTAAGLFGSVAGGDTYRGEIDLSPQYSTPSPAIANLFVGCSGEEGQNGEFTVTPAETLPFLGSGAYGFTVSAENVILDFNDANVQQASFYWPDMSIEGFHYWAFIIHDKNIDPTNAFLRFAGINTASMYGAGILFGHNSGTPILSISQSITGTNAPTNITPFNPPTAGTKVFLTLSNIDSTMQLCDSGHGVESIENPPYLENLATFADLGSIPTGTNLTISIIYGTSSTTTTISPLIVDFGDDSDTYHPFRQQEIIPITLPVGSVDGDFLKCSGAGTFGTKTVSVGDYFVLIEMTSDCIVWPSNSTLAALITSLDTTGINIVGDWNASTSLITHAAFTTFSNSHSTLTDNPDGSVQVVPVLSLPSYPSHSGKFYYGVQQATIATTADWYFDFIMPNLAADGSGTSLDIEVRNTGTFYSLSGVRCQISLTTSSGLTVGSRYRVIANRTLNRVEIYTIYNDVIDILTFYQSFSNGTVATTNIKAAISYVRNTNNTNLTAGFVIYNRHYAVILPIGVMDKQTYHISVADTYSIWDNKPLMVDDYVTFYNSTQKILQLREYTDASITNIVNSAVNGSSVKTTATVYSNDTEYQEVWVASDNGAGTRTIYELTTVYITSGLTVQNFNILGDILDTNLSSQYSTTEALTVGNRMTVLFDTTGGFGGTIHSVNVYDRHISTTVSVKIIPATLTYFNFEVVEIDGIKTIIFIGHDVVKTRSIITEYEYAAITEGFNLYANINEVSTNITNRKTDIYCYLNDGSAISSYTIDFTPYASNDLGIPRYDYSSYDIGEFITVVIDTSTGTGGTVADFTILDNHFTPIYAGAVITGVTQYLQFRVVSVLDQPYLKLVGNNTV